MFWYNFIKLVLTKVNKLAKGSLNNIFQDLFNKILSQQLTHDRSYMCFQRIESSRKTQLFCFIFQQLILLPNYHDFLCHWKRNLWKKKRKKKNRCVLPFCPFPTLFTFIRTMCTVLPVFRKKKGLQTNEEKEENPDEQPFLHFLNGSLDDRNSIFDLCSIRSLQLLSALTILKICFL